MLQVGLRVRRSLSVPLHLSARFRSSGLGLLYSYLSSSQLLPQGGIARARLFAELRQCPLGGLARLVALLSPPHELRILRGGGRAHPLYRLLGIVAPKQSILTLIRWSGRA